MRPAAAPAPPSNGAVDGQHATVEGWQHVVFEPSTQYATLSAVAPLDAENARFKLENRQGR